MPSSFTLFSTPEILILRFKDLPPAAWYEVTSLNDQDETGKLYGSEFLLYEAPAIDIQKIKSQFQGRNEIEINDNGVLYIYYRTEAMPSHAPGYGRNAKIGLDRDGEIARITIAWNAPGAGTPFVDRHAALLGLDYADGEPDIKPAPGMAG